MQFTGAVLVNLNSPTEKYEEKYQELVDKLKTELDLKQNFRVVYVNVYQNQLKVMFTLSKDKQADLQTIKEKISSRSVNIFEGVFKPVDGTKVILTNSGTELMVGGGIGKLERPDDSEGSPDEGLPDKDLLSERIKEVYDENGASSLEKNEQIFPRYDYTYDSDGDKMNMPFSLKKGMINQFNSMNVPNNLNPYKIANDPHIIKILC